MSGGVDSSVAAGLLQAQGYEVVGLTMCFNLPDVLTKRPGCCGLQGIEDARRVAGVLGIRHYVVSMQSALQKYVIDDFCGQYLAGRTPNPCVRCNQYVKFEKLLAKAKALGCRYLATGHYARITKHAKGLQLRKAVDSRKDQSYFLYRLDKRQLAQVLFPLGEFPKDRVRAMAASWKLPVADKPDSQEICFLPDNDYRGFLARTCASMIVPGPVVDGTGRILGEHRGTPFYTIGQREGLGIAAAHPWYVTRIDAGANTVTVGRREECMKRIFLVRALSFTGAPIKKKVARTVRIRYNHTEEPAQVIPQGDGLRICFQEPQCAITPGQAAVVYHKDTVIGGGVIEEVIE